MVKLVYCVTRRADIDREAFLHTWLHEHGPLVRRFAAAIGALRYVQSHTLDTPLNALLADSRGMATGYDGITELWFEGLDALNGALASEDGLAAAAALLADEQRFIDLSRSRLFLTEEHAVIG